MIEKVAAYIRSKLPEQFRNWTEEALEDYIVFHAQQRTMVVCCDLAGNIIGVLVAWGQDEDGHVPFRWQAHKPDGEHWWWDQVAAESSVILMGMFAEYVERHPKSVTRPGLWMRHGRTKSFRPMHLMETFKRGEAIYG
jgi:hypothetical protein